MSLILIIEDNADLAAGLRNNLEIEGYQVITAPDGHAGLMTATRNRPDLIVLDLMLPGRDGFSVLQSLRDQRLDTPVLILTARGTEEDKVRGLKLGADDYMTKPFGVLEFLARVEALLRRSSSGGSTEGAIDVGILHIDAFKRTVHRDGKEVALTPKEFDLLWALAVVEGRTVTREALMQTVWGYQAGVLSRTVDTHMLELRRKLEPDPSNPRYFLTVRSVGYRLAR